MAAVHGGDEVHEVLPLRRNLPDQYWRGRSSRGSRGCHCRGAGISRLIMSEEAKSERPQVVAIGWRCMKASTALPASVSRRQHRAVREDAGIDHQRLTGRTWLASEHDPC